MSEEEIVAALSIEAEDGGDMTASWVEIKLLWRGAVISTTQVLRENADD